MRKTAGICLAMTLLLLMPMHAYAGETDSTAQTVQYENGSEPSKSGSETDNPTQASDPREETVPDGWAGKKYYRDGQMLTGLQKIDGKYYYFSSKGNVQTGWKKYSGKRYYFTKTGSAGILGAAKTGLVKLDGQWFLFNKKGQMKTGMQTVDEKTYYFSPEGKTGAIGAAQTGWVTYKKYCYYFDPKDCTLVRDQIADGYKVDSKGRSKTRYLVLNIVEKYTRPSMTNRQKIKALFTYVTGNSWRYRRTYEHTGSSWTWYEGWQDDFSYQLITSKAGNCFRYAAVFGYLVKEATGYKVRVYHGDTKSSRGGLTPHGWCTVRIDGTWYAYDPDMYKFYTKRDVYYECPYSQTKNSIHRNGKYVKLY